MDTITSQQITAIIQQVGSIISAFWPIVLLLGGVQLGLYVIGKVRDMFVDYDYYDPATNSVYTLTPEDIKEFDEELKEEAEWKNHQIIPAGYKRLFEKKYNR